MKFEIEFFTIFMRKLIKSDKLSKLLIKRKKREKQS